MAPLLAGCLMLAGSITADLDNVRVTAAPLGALQSAMPGIPEMLQVGACRQDDRIPEM